MTSSNALTAHGVRLAQIPTNLPYEVKQGPDNAIIVIIGEQGHQHELILQLLKDAIGPVHADVAHVTIQAEGVTKGKSATAHVEDSGLSVIAGCPSHPFKFIVGETREGVIKIAGVCFDGDQIWDGVDQYEEQTGSVTWGKDTIEYTGEGDYGSETRGASMPRT